MSGILPQNLPVFRRGEDNDDFEDLIVLFSSTFLKQYERDIYDTLAYPPGFQIQFRYPEDIVANSVQVSKLEGREAVIIALAHEDFEFFPLRKVKITSVQRTGDYLVLDLELMPELVDYNSFSKDNVTRIVSRPVEPTESDEVVPGEFVSNCKKGLITFTTPNGETPIEKWRDQDLEWTNIVESMSSNEHFKNALFYRLISFSGAGNKNDYHPRHNPGIWWRTKQLVNRTVPTLNPVPRYWQKGSYIINSNEDYELKFEMRNGNMPIENSHSKFKIESIDGIDIIWDGFDLNFKADLRSIYVSPHDVPRQKVAPLICRSVGEATLPGPELEIPLVLKPSTSTRFFFFLLIFIGIAMTTGALNFIIDWFPAQFWILPTVSNNVLTGSFQLTGLAITTYAFDYYGAYFYRNQ
ncbi:hypothetical protein [Haloarcula nitratireducens]|uniref:Uncharacterized protein n=1 Tax=Haloarcula nitratireducens TaxID=2487749 RepID=A0AAW4PHL5_9EURY|nr:hypothetical protein [Halomicroarcula nitratireducens]MBX0297525.1 hypothetical protein [Halomicroarcula nitratireducens]